ncbi:Spo0B domain-containing protein [Nocardia otitidiscaviarum]|uniref:ATP-binding protein n=1 Tax=Nocardia otitidiscaviarum TaxID=1823 RepID=UPI0018937171|nr:sensor histidine kinase [Nocardia otitidiscaviarum]MBF6239592.1 Spo0B domain-containing protein [Nocardia otitidiscaviarum]
MRLRTQIVLLQVVVVTLTLGIAFGMFAYVSNERLSGEYGQRALAIARTVASEPALREQVYRYSLATSLSGDEMETELAAGPVQRIAEDARARTGALFVVVTDEAGIRLAHPDSTRLGERVSTDPSGALAGREVVIQEHGTLGESVRAKVPVLQPGSAHVVGEVSVGISTTAVHDQLLGDLRRAGLLAGGALLAGVLGSMLLARRWHGLTLGLEPRELAELVREQDAVLHGIGEGVVAADTAWRVTVVNEEARLLLGITGETGCAVDELGLTPRVLEVFRAADGVPVQAMVGDRIVVVTAREVRRDGRCLGAVLSARDRTDIESLTRQLDAVRSMSTVLRAQRHEFANRLHLISGLLHTDRPAAAAQYIDDLLGSGPLGAALPGMDAVHDPYLQAFLAAKAAHARESGVTLRLGPNTWIDGNLAVPVDVTTVLGNLLDNAIEAARTGEPPAVVEVELVQEDSTLHLTVADSGSGVPPALADAIFTEGVSTRPDSGLPGGRGIGLALARQLARAHGGDIRLTSLGGPAATPGAESEPLPDTPASHPAEHGKPSRGDSPARDTPPHAGTTGDGVAGAHVPGAAVADGAVPGGAATGAAAPGGADEPGDCGTVLGAGLSGGFERGDTDPGSGASPSAETGAGSARFAPAATVANPHHAVAGEAVAGPARASGAVIGGGAAGADEPGDRGTVLGVGLSGGFERGDTESGSGASPSAETGAGSARFVPPAAAANPHHAVSGDARVRDVGQGASAPRGSRCVDAGAVGAVAGGAGPDAAESGAAVSDAGAAGRLRGAEFIARMPGVLVRGDVAWAETM